IGPQEARILHSRLRPLLASADDLVPAYGLARQTSSTGFGMEDAFNLGQQHFATPTWTRLDVSNALADMSPAERQQYAKGALMKTLDQLKAIPGTASG